jgi:hypothetical protein
MPAKLIPGTSTIFFSNPHTGDRVINLTDFPEIESTLNQEDIIVIGRWSDYTGSGTKGPQEVLLQGISTEEKTPAQELVGDETVVEVTDRGNRSTTTRQRNKLVYIK